MYGELSVRRDRRYSRIGFSKGLINEACGELTASPYIELQSDLGSPLVKLSGWVNRRVKTSKSRPTYGSFQLDEQISNAAGRKGAQRLADGS